MEQIEQFPFAWAKRRLTPSALEDEYAREVPVAEPFQRYERLSDASESMCLVRRSLAPV